VFVRAPIERLLLTPADRFRYILNVLVRDLELPVERDDLLTLPDDNAALAQSVSLAGRKALYNYIVHGIGAPEKALQQWVGRPLLEQLRLQLMREKVAGAGMDVGDFSKSCQAMVPLTNDRWRGDAQSQTVLMREIAIFRAEKQRRRQELAEMSEAARGEREARAAELRRQLQTVNKTPEELQWSGPEPTRLTFNRLVERGDEQPDLMYDGRGPKTTRERWECGVRRLAFLQAVGAEGQEFKQLMLDERLYNRMVLYVELGLHDDPTRLLEEMLEMQNNGETQWTRKKKRTNRWAFNFDLGDGVADGEEKSGEEDNSNEEEPEEEDDEEEEEEEEENEDENEEGGGAE
jgi:hypothetical protein